MRRSSLSRRVEALEDRSAIGTDTGIRHVEVEELEAFWDSWEGSPAPSGPGIALIPRELTLGEWANRYGSIEFDADRPTEEKPTWQM